MRSQPPSAVRLCLEGEMTIYRAAELKPILLAALERGQHIELDLANVTELDCAGVQLLLLLKREADAGQKALALVGLSAPVLEVFELANLFEQLGASSPAVAREGSQ